jgi:hypothetical protein
VTSRLTSSLEFTISLLLYLHSGKDSMVVNSQNLNLHTLNNFVERCNLIPGDRDAISRFSTLRIC